MGVLKKEEQRYGCGRGIFYNKWEKTFTPACTQHDIDYIEKKISRKVADKQFLDSMIEVAN